jgi:hypothetical protein
MTELGGALRRIWVDGRPIERLAYVVGLALFVSGLVHVGVLLVTGWTWIGPVSLRKAATFGLSFGLTVASLAWVTSFLRLPARRLVLGVFLVTSVVETTLISMQAWRGVPSHFNFETPFDTAVSMTLALGGGVLIVVGIVCTVAAFVGAGALAPSMALAVRTGLVVLLVAFATGAVMVARGVTASRSGAAQLAYDTAGSLKPLHAVAMHAVLVLPALAWLLAHTSWAEERRLRLVGVAVAADAVLTAVIGYEAFAGIPPLAPPLGLGVLSGVALVVLAATGVLALRATSAVPRPA